MLVGVKVGLSSHFDFGDRNTSILLHADSDEIKHISRFENGLIYSIDGKRLLSFDYEYNNDDEVQIKDGVICVCEGAFSSYKANRKLNISLPKSLRFFTKESFDYKYKRLSWKTPWFIYDNGCIYSKDFSSLLIQHLTNVKLNTNLKIIERNCFNRLDCTDIVLPDSVRIIKKGAFEKSTMGETLIFPDGLQVIEDQAFKNCCNVKMIQFSRQLIYLGAYSFHMCDNLESISFPKECLLKDYGTPHY